MRVLLLIALAFLAVCCKSREQSLESDSASDSASIDTTAVNPISQQPTPTQSEVRRINYTEEQLMTFLDSVAKIPTEELLKNTDPDIDSIFRNQEALNVMINNTDFQALKTAVKNKGAKLEIINRIFKNPKIDSSYLSLDSIPVTLISFDANPSSYNEFAICLGYPSGMQWENEIYFFSKNKIIAKHSIFHRYGLNLKHFKDSDGKTVIYYKQNFGSGSGIWWFNFYFYKYIQDELVPVLNELENANLQSPWGPRVLWLESTVESINPLELKIVYYVEMVDSVGERLRIINDSTLVRYTWNESSTLFEGDYKASKISKAQIFSYYLDYNELLFIKTHYKTLKNALKSKKKRNFVLQYLNDVKFYTNHP